jgi:ferredoxin
MWRVNENCIGCGMCASIAPDIFTMTEEGVAKVAMQPTGDQTVGAAEARDSCPVAAIED